MVSMQGKGIKGVATHKLYRSKKKKETEENKLNNTDK